MSSLPAEIAGIGSTQQKLRVSPGFDPLKAQVGPDEYFVLSRIDGTQSLRDVLLATGLPPDRAVAIVTKLRSIGALLLPGESATPPPASVPQATRPPTARPGNATPAAPITPPTGVARPRPAPVQPPPKTRSNPNMRPMRPASSEQPPVQVEPKIDTSLPNPTQVELAALTEDVQLEDQDRRRILALARLTDAREPWALLGIPKDSDAKLIKRAYFKLSKDIHPDRYYGKRLGSFGPRLAVVFEAVSRAYAKLTNPDRRSTGAHPAVGQDQPQTPQEYAAELFDRACQVEVTGDVEGAMKLFSAAVRIDSQTRYLRRAANCALRANQPKTAVEYAKKAQQQAPDDPSSARLLATSFRAVGKLADAEEVLVMAMAMKSENDVLTAELRNDLAEIRRLIQAGA